MEGEQEEKQEEQQEEEEDEDFTRRAVARSWGLALVRATFRRFGLAWRLVVSFVKSGF